MKKLFAAILAVLMLIGCCACADSKEKDVNSPGGSPNGTAAPVNQSAEPTKVDLHITEVGYVTGINEVYTNTGNYKGKNIQIEGMFKSEAYSYNGQNLTARYVYRTGPGCCGNDGTTCGFEFESADGTYPAATDWVSVVGTLDTYTEVNKGETYTFLVLRNARYTVLPESERGAATVSA